MGTSVQKRDPVSYATVLIKETQFSAQEIAELSGLDIYKVTALKLKSRKNFIIKTDIAIKKLEAIRGKILISGF